MKISHFLLSNCHTSAVKTRNASFLQPKLPHIYLYCQTAVFPLSKYVISAVKTARVKMVIYYIFVVKTIISLLSNCPTVAFPTQWSHQCWYLFPFLLLGLYQSFEFLLSNCLIPESGLLSKLSSIRCQTIERLLLHSLGKLSKYNIYVVKLHIFVIISVKLSYFYIKKC